MNIIPFFSQVNGFWLGAGGLGGGGGGMEGSDYKLVCSSFDVTSILWLEQCHVGQHIIGSGIL